MDELPEGFDDFIFYEYGIHAEKLKNTDETTFHRCLRAYRAGHAAGRESRQEVKVNVGFFNSVSNKPLYSAGTEYTDVYDICRSDNGKIIAFATSRDDAYNIVDALNNTAGAIRKAGEG